MPETPKYPGYEFPDEERKRYNNLIRPRVKDALTEIDGMIGTMLQQEMITEARFERLHRHFEAYLVQWTLVEWLLHKRPQGDSAQDRMNRSFLTSWLTEHPEFVEDVLRGQWPKWLPEPPTDKKRE